MLHVSSLGAKALAVSLSVSAHLAVALVVAHQAYAPTIAHAVPTNPLLLEIAAPDLEPASVPLSGARVTASTSHKHPYPAPSNHDAIPHDPSLTHHQVKPVDQDAPIAAAPAIAEAPPTAAPRFVMTLGNAIHAPGGATASNGVGSGTGQSVADEPFAEAAVDSPAQLLRGDPPGYTAEAEAAGIEAEVPLEIVLDETGAVARARALARAGYGLEEAALRSIRAYRFAPARRNGRAAVVRMRWMMRFQLR
jgi:protein TonB